MLNNKNSVFHLLRQLNLTSDEATLYMELLREPNTHLKLAHATGINRTKVYRLAQDLQKRSLISQQTDDRGTFLVAADPATLEIELVNQEEKLKSQREAFSKVIPALSLLQANGRDFAINTYDGVEGFKQMLWHELKTEGENLIFGSGTIDDLVHDAQWAEKHRTMTIQTNYKVREIINAGGKKPTFTLQEDFMKKHYRHRVISTDILSLPSGQQIVIYNETVGIYNWGNGRAVGLEIINQQYCSMMRAMFGHYWELAKLSPEYVK